MKRLALSMAAAILSSGSICADAGITGNQLHTLCQSSAESDNFACTVYIRGVIDGSDVAQHYTERHYVCLPDEWEGQQAIDLVTSWLVKNPQHRHHPAVLIIDELMTTVWGCKPPQPQPPTNQPKDTQL